MNVVNFFVPLGYAVYSIDHIGHGKSDGERVFVERFQDYTATLKIFIDIIQDWQPEKPIFIVGHSMGGLMSASFLLEHQDKISGAVLSGPAIKVPDTISKATILAGKALSILMPQIGVTKLDSESLCRDPAVVDAYNNDPLVHTEKITARLGAEFIKTMQEVSERASEIKVPILIVQGSDDKLADPSGAQLLYDLVGSEEKKITFYDGFYHEIFNEPEHEQVLNDVNTWLQKQLGAK
jgi:alpha-beta hydrolase superfamily lysophospholipase